jgi:D-alanyl-D-alanine carboxypeptidase
MLRSANDAAAALAYEISGSIEAFSELMNKKAYELGLLQTNFENPHGLDSENHHTSAHDLAIISAYAISNPVLKEICSTKKVQIDSSLESRILINHNKFLSMYDGCIGIKTGFTRKSGRCLVACAERDGLTFISVTLDAPSDWSDHKKMLNYGFECLERITLAEPEEYCYKIPLLDAEKENIIVSNPDGESIITSKGEHDIKKQIRMVRYAVAPISAGDKLGEIIFTIDGKETKRINLIANETILKKKEKGLFDRLLSIFK